MPIALSSLPSYFINSLNLCQADFVTLGNSFFVSSLSFLIPSLTIGFLLIISFLTRGWMSFLIIPSILGQILFLIHRKAFFPLERIYLFQILSMTGNSLPSFVLVVFIRLSESLSGGVFWLWAKERVGAKTANNKEIIIIFLIVSLIYFLFAGLGSLF